MFLAKHLPILDGLRFAREHNTNEPRQRKPMRASVFCGTSVDGFIARRDDALDFLPDDGGEPHGFEEFFASIDVLVIGRRTFEKVSSFAAWPYGGKRVVVLSHGPVDLSRFIEFPVQVMNGTPAEILARLEAEGARHAYVDGGRTIQAFLRAGLIRDLTVTRVPVLIGEGIPLFGSLAHDLRLRHVATTSYASGLVKSSYEVQVTSPPL